MEVNDRNEEEIRKADICVSISEAQSYFYIKTYESEKKDEKL